MREILFGRIDFICACRRCRQTIKIMWFCVVQRRHKRRRLQTDAGMTIVRSHTVAVSTFYDRK